jgi:hypothetical protein
MPMKQALTIKMLSSAIWHHFKPGVPPLALLAIKSNSELVFSQEFFSGVFTRNISCMYYGLCFNASAYFS